MIDEVLTLVDSLVNLADFQILETRSLFVLVSEGLRISYNGEYLLLQSTFPMVLSLLHKYCNVILKLWKVFQKGVYIHQCGKYHDVPGTCITLNESESRQHTLKDCRMEADL